MDQSKLVTEKRFQEVMTTIYLSVVQTKLFLAAYERALIESKVLSEDQARLIREQARLEAKAYLDALAAPTPELLAQELLKFDGPVQ